MPQVLQGRTTHDELEAFLDEIMVPVDEYYKEYGFLHHPGCGWICFQIICYMIFPLACFMLCYLLNAASSAKLKMAECKQKVELICKQRGTHFMERDMMWVVPPQQFPRWIEFWTTLGNNNRNNTQNQSFNTSMMTQGQDISVMPMLQQGYQQQQNYGGSYNGMQQQRYPPQQQQQGYPQQHRGGNRVHPQFHQNMQGGGKGYQG